MASADSALRMKPGINYSHLPPRRACRNKTAFNIILPGLAGLLGGPYTEVQEGKWLPQGPIDYLTGKLTIMYCISYLPLLN